MFAKTATYRNSLSIGFVYVTEFWKTILMVMPETIFESNMVQLLAEFFSSDSRYLWFISSIYRLSLTFKLLLYFRIKYVTYQNVPIRVIFQNSFTCMCMCILVFEGVSCLS